MNEIIRLTKLFLNESLGFSQFFYNRKYNQKGFLKQLVVMVIVPIALIPAYVMYISFMTAVYFGLKMINQTSVFLSSGYILTTVMILVFGIMVILSEFYFSKHMEELVPLPISSRKLIISKFFSIISYEYIFSGLIFVPVLIIYGVGEGMGSVYVFLSMLVFLTVPVLPLALLTALIMLVMQSISLKGRKDVLQIIFVFMGVGVIFGIQIWLTSQFGKGTEGDFQLLLNALLSDQEVFLNTLGYAVPTSFLLAWALNKISLMSFVWAGALLLVTFLSVAVMVFIGERVYIKSIVSGSVIRKGKPLSKIRRERAIGRKSHGVMAVFLMDLRLLFRTPIYFFNNVSVVIIAPACILISLFFLDLTPEDLQGIKNFYQEMPMVVHFLLVSFFIFFGGTSATTATTFSREGKCSWVTRMVPLSARDQIFGRTGVALLVQSMGIVFTIGCLYFILALPFLSLLLVLILGVMGSLPILLFGLLLDLNRPLLNWDNPQKAVKNNMNVLFTLFAGMAYAGLLIGLSMAAGFFISDGLGYGIFAAVSVAMTVLFWRIIQRQLEKKLLKFE
jgi:ABC-2 type transport system permease protein